MAILWSGFDWLLFYVGETYAIAILIAIIQAANISRNLGWWNWQTQNVAPFFKPPTLFYQITAAPLVLSAGAVIYLYGRIYFLDRFTSIAVDPTLNLDWYTACMSLLFSAPILLVLRTWLINGFGQMGPAMFLNGLGAAASACLVWMMWISKDFLAPVVFMPFAAWHVYIAICDIAVWLATPPGPAPIIFWNNDIELPPSGPVLTTNLSLAAQPKRLVNTVVSNYANNSVNTVQLRQPVTYAANRAVSNGSTLATAAYGQQYTKLQ